LKLKYPFPLDEKNNLFQEFQEYGLKDNLKIGEIGAGSGLISLLMASTYDHLEIYMNELNFGLLKYMEARISQFPTLRKSNKLLVVKGSRKTTNLEGKNLDMVFMRDAFHHFSKKEAMVASIYQSLSEQGVAFVIEHVTDGMTEPPSCLLAMKKDDIIQLFEDGGFLLVGVRSNGGDYIFKFQK
jgi:ubiquinone/menaquinone biosynthesis C-methylase UbiE